MTDRPPAAPTPGRSDRDPRIDLLRVVAFVAVVVLHTTTQNTATFGPLVLVNMTARFAVPVYFLISGYLIATSTRPAPAILAHYAGRLIPVFLFWLLAYNIVELALGLDNDLIRLTPRHALDVVMTGGTAYHLWFLSSMLLTTTFYLLLYARAPWLIWPVAVLLFGLGLAIGPYSEASGLVEWTGRVVVDPLKYTARDGPFFWLLFLAIGATLRRHLPLSRRGRVIAAVMVPLGLALHVAEARFLVASGHRLYTFDLLIGSSVMGIGLFATIMSTRPHPFMAETASFGPSILGAFCIHVAIYKGLYIAAALGTDALGLPRIDPGASGSYLLFITLATIYLSLVTARALARAPLFRRFVV